MRIALGLVGAGFGLRYLDDLTQTVAGQSLLDVKAVCDVDPARVTMAAKTFGCRAFSDLDSMLATPDLDAIALFTGPAGRAELIRKIIHAGKHVMTTKPFELDSNAAMRVLWEAQRLGMIIHLNSPSPNLREDLRQIQDWQKEFSLGRAVSAHFQTWCSYRETSDGSWYDNPRQCPLAPVLRLGVYAINDILHFLRDPTEVQVMHSRLCTSRPTPDHAQLAIQFRGGELATIFASFCIDSGVPYPDRLTLNFERGCVYRNAMPAAGARTAELRLVARNAHGQPIFAERNFSGDHCTGHWAYPWEDFCRAVRGQPIATSITPQQIVAGIRVIEAMAQSERTGQPQPVQVEVPLLETWAQTTRTKSRTGREEVSS